MACLSCDYERQVPSTEALLELGVWCLGIRWSGETATLKEAALLRQFVPLFRERPISEVRQMLGRASEWTEDALSEASVLRLREAAEARGFTVHVRPGGREWPRLKLPRPGSGMTGYCVRLSPAFLERSHILATFGPAGGVVSIAHGASSTETADIPRTRGRLFLEEITAFEPLGIPDDSRHGMDGVSLEGLVQEERGNHRFFAWSPEPDTAPRQHGFVLALLRLAMNVAREPGTVEYLEQLFGYVDNGLPARMFDETPRRIRLFGRLSSTHAKALQAMFGGVDSDERVLMDLSNLEGMGTLLYPLFARFHERRGRTAWRVSAPAARHLKEAGIPSDWLFETLERARAALLDG